MLEIVATNLAENAIRYAGPGTTFTLTVRAQGGEVVLSGVDDGAGVPDEDLPRIFERFYRSDRARASRGTGLGLAIVKHVIAAAGGTVDATNRPGGGLDVRCTLPV
jgi:signal transduction histidine kinase